MVQHSAIYFQLKSSLNGLNDENGGAAFILDARFANVNSQSVALIKPKLNSFGAPTPN